MQNTRNLLKYLFRFKCPKCGGSSYEAQVMQVHLLCCQKDHTVQNPKDLFDLAEDEIKLEMKNISVLSDDHNSRNDFDNFEFEDSKSEIDKVNVKISELKPNSVRVKQEPLEPNGNFDENENAQAPIEDIEIAKSPKIDKVFNFEQALAIHENKEAESTQKKKDFNCNQMNKTNINYFRPRMTYKVKKLFVCEWENCGKKFNSNYHRNTHYRVHTGERPYACDWKNCHKTFKTKSYRKVHFATHTGQKPFACDWPNCGQKFITNQNRIKHYQTHTGEKPYVCNRKNCTNRFAQHVQHSKDHSEVTPIVTIKTPEESLTSTNPEVWRGEINMPDVANFGVTAHQVSGTTDYLNQDLKETLKIVGRIPPETVWDYVRYAAETKEILLVSLLPATKNEQLNYSSFFKYLQDRGCFGVVGNNSKMVKDCFIIALPENKPIHQYLMPLDGPGLDEDHKDVLLALIVRSKRKRSHDGTPVSSGTKRSKKSSFTEKLAELAKKVENQKKEISMEEKKVEGFQGLPSAISSILFRGGGSSSSGPPPPSKPVAPKEQTKSKECRDPRKKPETLSAPSKFAKMSDVDMLKLVATMEEPAPKTVPKTTPIVPPKNAPKVAPVVPYDPALADLGTDH